jgi:hypothetical protein
VKVLREEREILRKAAAFDMRAQLVVDAVGMVVSMSLPDATERPLTPAPLPGDEVRC